MAKKKKSSKKIDASVVLCVYNASKRIKPCLDSLLAQNYSPERWELIIVDDASKDNTPELVRKMIRGVKNARLLVHKKNKGLGGSRNTGIAEAKGEFIFFTDDDCIVPEGWIKNGVKAFKDEPDGVGAIAGDVRIPKHSYIADCISYMGFPAGGNLGFPRMFHVDDDGFSNSFTTANTLARKSALDQLQGPFDESLRKIQDKDVALRLQGLGYKIRYHPELTITHMAMPSLKGYFKKMWVKGKYGRMVLGKHKGQRSVYGHLRAKGIFNILWHSPKKYLPGIIPLAALGYGTVAVSYLRSLALDR